MSVPRLSADAITPGEIGRALREGGGFLLHPPFDADLCARAVAAAHEFFALPRAAKEATAIERSRHFRGWSEMHNERDWREQIHLGRERAATGEAPPERLEGPNLWPLDERWRATITAYLDAVSALGERLLACVAADLGLSTSPFAGVGREGYVLLKLIGYHPQPSAHIKRPGVAPHVDFSWLTLTLQDSPGLEVLSPGGEWTQIEASPGGLWVHPGELLQFASGGVYAATPHRVINPSLDRTRVSLPFFLNPPLTGKVAPLVAPAAVAPPAEIVHVHRVFAPGSTIGPFHFGQAEWLRKGCNGWCYDCSPPRASAATPTAG